MAFVNRDIFKDTSWLWSLKGYAILGIVLYHWFDYYNSYGMVANLGGQGVHIFIILSAFGLTLSYENTCIGWLAWYRKRLSRIIIPYYLSILFVVFSIFVFGLAAGDIYRYLELSELNYKTLLASILFYRAFIDKYVLAINSPWWFVITILQLYLVFPLVYRFVKKHGSTALLITLLLTCGYEAFYAIILKSNSAVFSKLFMAYLFEYSVGIYIANVYINNTDIFGKYTVGKKPLMFGLAMEAIGIGLVFYGTAGLAFNDIFNAVGYFVIALNLCSWLHKYKVIWYLLGWLGRYSMPIFLLHAPYIYLVFNNYKNNGHNSHILWLPAYLVFVGTISFLFSSILDRIKLLNSIS